MMKLEELVNVQSLSFISGCVIAFGTGFLMGYYDGREERERVLQGYPKIGYETFLNKLVLKFGRNMIVGGSLGSIPNLITYHPSPSNVIEAIIFGVITDKSAAWGYSVGYNKSNTTLLH